MSHDQDPTICKTLRKLYESLPCELKLQVPIESVVQRFVHPDGVDQLYTILKLYRATCKDARQIPRSVTAMIDFIEIRLGCQHSRKTTIDHENKRLRFLFEYLDPAFQTIGMGKIEESIQNGEINSIIDHFEKLHVQQQCLHDMKTLTFLEYFKSLLYTIQHRRAQLCLLHNDVISWC
jgi:hypothetical protein